MIILIRGFGEKKNIPLVCFLDPIVAISEPVKLQSDNDADIADLKGTILFYVILSIYHIVLFNFDHLVLTVCVLPAMVTKVVIS